MTGSDTAAAELYDALASVARALGNGRPAEGMRSTARIGSVLHVGAEDESREMEYELERDIDLRSFLGIENEERHGVTRIRAHARVKAPTGREELEELCTYVQQASPVRDVLANGVPVETSIEALA